LRMSDGSVTPTATVHRSPIGHSTSHVSVC